MTKQRQKVRSLYVLGGAIVLVLAGCQSDTPPTQASGVDPRVMADNLHAIMEADRTVYAKVVVDRLAAKEGVIKASEHWKDDKALPLPAQMFRMGAELVAQKGVNVSYALISTWPINKKNAPGTEAEKQGLAAISQKPGENYYTQEELGGKKYFMALYPDIAVAAACVECHNKHRDTPKTDFKTGDIMGAIVIRFPL